MDFFNFLTMIGGLALFLFGMKIMGDALSKLAGGKLEQVLEKMTNNPVKGVLLGCGVTAVIQSSSATTVMVVGFVNSGIMKLSQAVGIIMGANVGTTVTSWMLSLTGIEGTNFFLRLLKPSSFSPVLALIGIFLIMFVKSDKKKDIGTILIGFAVLMFGMETMSDAVKPLAEVPAFTSLFTAFTNPILGMIAGAVLTAVIQSSSASVGILQAMCVTGSISIGAALPIIMGQNIGTCFTALISGVGASKNAKRASLVHLYFNLIGTILFMSVFYGINAFVHFDFLSETANGAVIAIIHSVFNVAATLILLPASKLIEKLAYLTIPQKDEEKTETEMKVLDERFLERPAFAVAQCKNAICEVAQLCEKTIGLCVLANEVYDGKTIQGIMEIEDIVDIKEDELTMYLSKLTAKPLSEKDSKNVGMYGKCITDFERITDYAKGIAYAQKKLYAAGDTFSQNADMELRMIFEATQEIVEITAQAFIHEDTDVALRVDALASVISTLKKDIRVNHNRRLSKGKCTIEMGMTLIDIMTSLERIARHCSNIVEEQLATDTDKFAVHQYLRSVKESNENYRDMKSEYYEKYNINKAKVGLMEYSDIK